MGSHYFNSLVSAGRNNLPVDSVMTIIHLEQVISKQPFLKKKQQQKV